MFGNKASIFLAVAVLFGLAEAFPQQNIQQIQLGVKGGHNATNHFNQWQSASLQSRNATGVASNNATAVVRNIDEGVCYKEVPTATLVKDPNNVPAGNGSRPGYSRIRSCCTGYQRNIHSFRRCDPVCETECVNALCTAPNKCTCFPDHVRDLGGNCVPTCPIGCLNGECAGTECMCKPGYKLDDDSKYCKPVCANGCAHGNCTAPNTCSCESGYAVGPNGQCQASCGQCEHGDCVGPNLCACHKGYSKTQQGQCAPICSKGCDNGICVAPDVCTCQYGFELSETGAVCQPRCITPCTNGRCTGADTCTCNPGFVKDTLDPTGTRCIPNCPNGCPNGVCSGPNFCLCNHGFVKDRSIKGSQICVRRTRRSLEEIEKKLTFSIPLV